MFAARRHHYKLMLVASTASILFSSFKKATNEALVKKDPKDVRIVIVGGGSAGLGIASMLVNEGMKNITIIEPKKVHFYQPLWTLVGAGVKSCDESVKNMADIIPKHVLWINKPVITFNPEDNEVNLADGTKLTYDYLVVAAGIQIDWHKIEGLKESLSRADSGVVCIYDFEYAKKTWQAFSSLQHQAKRMIFTMPGGLIKCAGAPQKIMWLLEDMLRESKLRDQIDVEYWSAGNAMFGIKYYSDQLENVRKEKDVRAVFKQELISIDIDRKVAIFKDLDKNTISEQCYDFLHVVPPMSAPDFIKLSPLADTAGWMSVNKHTMQSTQYTNIFGIGDCTNTPNSKTFAAISSQAPVLVHNLRRQIEGREINGRYNGYACCPLIIGRNNVNLAEFAYDGEIIETFDHKNGTFPLSLIGQRGFLQQRFFYWLKAQFFPFAYWQLWMRGRWFGTNGPFKPDVTNPEKSV